MIEVNELTIKLLLYAGIIFGAAVTYLIIVFVGWIDRRLTLRKEYIKSLDDKAYRKYTEFLRG